ncbi:hypothetical protein QL285_079309 [Trifolium repens]|nr:hypothetical protein QL285_079309 [Trifolium repens]
MSSGVPNSRPEVRIRGCIASSADPNVVLDILNILLYHKIRWVISLQDGGTAVRWLKEVDLVKDDIKIIDI